MHLTSYETEGQTVRAGYTCPCGCKPTIDYERGGQMEANICCCGNEFVVGRDAERLLAPRDGFRLETETRVAPWGETITAAWLVGPSVHPEPAGAHAHDHGHDDGHGGGGQTVVDPVCGMSVEPATAMEKGLHSQHKGADYYFCGKGCKLDFEDDPERFLDPAYVPSM